MYNDRHINHMSLSVMLISFSIIFYFKDSTVYFIDFVQKNLWTKYFIMRI